MLDSELQRFSFSAKADGLPAGHYRVSSVKRLAPSQQPYGPGRVFLADLTEREVSALLDDEKAEETLDNDRIRIGNISARFENLGKYGESSIHGGGESLSFSMSKTNFQPLTVSSHAVRIHNANLVKLMDLLAPRLRCQQMIILTVSGG